MIYFDNAATTMKKPEQVAQAVVEAFNTLGNAGRGGHEATLGASRMIFDTRVKLAELFHAENPKQIAFTSNATESLNLVIKGTLKRGDHVITTQLEHNSVLRPLYEMQDKGVELTIIPSNRKGCIDIHDFERGIQNNTRMIICTHGSNLTGNLLDIGAIGSIARSHQILFCVDASQTAGVFPIDVQKMNIDFLCFTGHKSLLGPQGTGGVYVREGIHVSHLKSGGSGVQTYSRSHPPQMPTALEAGTLNGHGLAGLNAAIDYLNKTGIDVIRKKELELMRRFYRGVKEIPGVKIYGDFGTEIRCPIVALNLRDYDSAQVSDELFMTYDIAVRPGAHCAPLMHQALGTVERGAVRFSFSHYNTIEEVDFAVKAIQELV